MNKEGGKDATELNVYSYHTFLFPFRWETNPSKNMDVFVQNLDLSEEAWSELLWENEVFDAHRDRRIEYNEHEYFHENVRNAIYGTENHDVVRNFTFRKDRLKEKATDPDSSVLMTITKSETTWELTVNAIRLKIFNTGIGILTYELENRKHRSMDDVLRINEYGRRIDIPYVSVRDNSCSHVADRVEISDVTICDFAKAISEFSSLTANYKFISPIITDVLGHGFSFSKEAGKIPCHVIGDDRMFVCCLVDDDSLIRETAVWDNDKHMYAWERDCIDKPHWEQSKLYDFIFIDGTGLSCIDRNKRLELLKKHLYTRFMEYNPELKGDEERTNYGTFAAVTPHSMVCVTNYIGEIVPFLTMRIQMATLVLAQRAAIISLCHEAAALATGFDSDGHVSRRQVKKISKLQENYVAFQNQMLFFEMTAQEQGVDMYKKLQESLYIQDQKDQLEVQLQNLHDIASLIATGKTERILALIAVVGGLIALTSMICDLSSCIS